VGDETFDWLLYATKRPNRVVARSLLETGAAAQAGVEAGDMIVRYDGRSIFKWGELQHATRQGQPGRPVVMEVMSPGGDTRRVTVPSGPLGIQLGQAVVTPQSVR
jgi:S1-C subfamily serine protease